MTEEKIQSDNWKKDLQHLRCSGQRDHRKTDTELTI